LDIHQLITQFDFFGARFAEKVKQVIRVPTERQG